MGGTFLSSAMVQKAGSYASLAEKVSYYELKGLITVK